ncbi:hypothetical protein [Paraliomyxa miuraensis]|uniref:hypothetical protein n=1 Tax=Paraliomyxa miuraensis TaxID=376150 RepID=UPI00224FD0AC|nr:hypothetical protein [Paraliomyxa miuraensis]MCX4241231.1 hypothetical protein [Paraliomyxa miuraensis]
MLTAVGAATACSPGELATMRDGSGRAAQVCFEGPERAVAAGANARACSGEVLPTCSPGWTGPGCDWPCDGAECSFASYCHGDGRTWGLAAFGARLFEASPKLPDEEIHALFEQFVVEHPEDLGLAAGVSPEDLDLVPAPAFRAPAGKLEVLRFEQKYRGIPVYGPDGTVRVTLGPRGAIAFDGAIVDGRQDWANVEEHASEGLARRSILSHAVERSGLSVGELELASLRLVAVPRVQRVGWMGTVRSGLSPVTTIVVDADPEASVPLPILHAEHIEAAGLADEVDVSVLAEDPASDVFGSPDQTASLAQLFDASPLRGSTRGGEVIVGTERVVGYDLSSAMSFMGINTVPPLASVTTNFDAAPGTIAYDVQNDYVRVQSYYAFVDQYMAGVWESLNVVPSIPPGQFEPRVMLWVQPGFDLCPMQSYCANYVSLEGLPTESIADEYEQPFGGPTLENGSRIAIEFPGASAHVLAHEFGHIVDLFAAPYFVGAGLGCTGAPGCMPSCQPDTSEEAPALREAVAQVFTIAATSELFPMATFDDCDPLPAISLGADGAPHNDACRPGGEPYSHFLDPASCAVGAHCDHDFAAQVDPPTGLCAQSRGYRVDSLHQAFWEIFHGERCAATPPYVCTPMNLPPGLSASDAFMPAFLYALRIDANSVRQFIDAFATHVSCNLGAVVYQEVNEVLCHHDLRACGAPPPATCETCGNGVREDSELCDGNDLGGASCVGLEFSGGLLACDASCMLDTSMCDAAEGADVTGATDVDNDVTGPGATDGDATGGGGVNDDGGGCECSTGSNRGADLVPTGLGLLALVGARRRRRRARANALVVALTGLAAQACSAPTVRTETEASDEDPSTTGESGSESGSTEAVGGPLPQWALGDFSSAVDKVGMSFSDNLYAWANVHIDETGTFLLDMYVCAERQELQAFRWTSASDGQSLNIQPVPPSEVFTFGNGSQVSEVIVEPSDSCDTIVVRSFHVEALSWSESHYHRGNVCARTTVPDGCAFTYEWCDNKPPPPCE